MITIVIVIIVFIIILEMYRELHTFQVTEYEVVSPALKGLEKEKRIVFLSDLHNHVYGEDNEKLFQAIRDAKPDMILIGGDMLVGKKGVSYEPAKDFVVRLPEIAPVYYANGNHEQRMKEELKEYHKTLEEAGIHFLENATEDLELDGVPVHITGLEIPSRCYTHFRTRPMKTEEITGRVGKRKKDGYQILLAHNPAYVREYRQWGADLILCGHLHGGMVRLPFIGGVIAPSFELFPKHSGEMRQEGGTAVVVSKGLGTHTIHIRLFNPAEVIVLKLTGEGR